MWLIVQYYEILKKFLTKNTRYNEIKYGYTLPCCCCWKLKALSPPSVAEKDESRSINFLEETVELGVLLLSR